MNEMQFVVYRYPEGSKRAGKARNVERQAIAYDDFSQVAKAVIPLLQKTKVRAKTADSDK